MFKAGDARDRMSTTEKTLMRVRVTEQWDQERPPSHGLEFEAWVTARAEEFEVKPDYIKKILLENAQDVIHAVQSAMVPISQSKAKFWEAGLDEAMVVLRDSMRADRTILTKDGTPIVVPDHPTRVMGAKEVIKIFGGYAPERTESVSAIFNFSTSGDTDRDDEEYERNKREVERIRRARAEILSQECGVGTSTEVQTGATGQTLLVDPMYGNGRQPGRAQSVQAIPSPLLHQAVTRPARRRARGADREKPNDDG